MNVQAGRQESKRRIRTTQISLITRLLFTRTAQPKASSLIFLLVVVVVVACAMSVAYVVCVCVYRVAAVPI